MWPRCNERWEKQYWNEKEGCDDQMRKTVVGDETGIERGELLFEVDDDEAEEVIREIYRQEIAGPRSVDARQENEACHEHANGPNDSGAVCEVSQENLGVGFKHDATPGRCRRG